MSTFFVVGENTEDENFESFLEASLLRVFSARASGPLGSGGSWQLSFCTDDAVAFSSVLTSAVSVGEKIGRCD